MPLALGVLGWFGLSRMGCCCCAAGSWLGLCIVFSLFMVWFFRHPERVSPTEPGVLVSGADGVVKTVEVLDGGEFFPEGKAVRVSVFLSPLDVHVNRCPMEGTVKKLAYRPGRHLLTMDEKSAFYNQHSVIVIEDADGVRCLAKQITGPIVRRVVYWLEEGQQVERGGVLGMMKFGSRMDVWFQADRVEICVKPGDRVKAGLSIIGRKKQR